MIDVATLKGLRVHRGLSQQQLAARSGLPRSTVVNIELGLVANPRLDTALALAKGLGVDVRELVAS